MEITMRGHDGNGGDVAVHLSTMKERCILKTGLSVVLAVMITAACGAVAARAASAPPKVMFPEDLGPAQIDVSGYPAEYRETYKKILVPLFQRRGELARIINSPIIEMDSRLEASERHDHPELFSDPALAEISGNGWKKKVREIHDRPSCCGACPVLSMKDARRLWRFLVYDSIARKTGAKTGSWIALRRQLLQRFKKDYPQRYHELYPKIATQLPEEPHGKAQ